MAVVDASNASKIFTSNTVLDVDVNSPIFTPSSKYQWTTTNNIQISLFSFFGDLTVDTNTQLTGGKVQAIIATNGADPFYTVSGLNADAIDLADSDLYWREILAGKTTIYAPDLKAAQADGDFTLVSGGEKLTGSADIIHGGTKLHNLTQNINGDAESVSATSSLKGGNDVITATNGGSIFGDALDASGNMTGGNDTISLADNTSVKALIGGDSYWGATSGVFRGGDDIIALVNALSSETLGDAHFVGKDAKGGDDKISVTNSTVSYLAGDGFDSVTAGVIFGGNDVINVDNSTISNATGDFDSITGGEAHGGNDTMQLAAGAITLLFGDARVASGASSVFGGNDLIDAAETAATTIVGDVVGSDGAATIFGGSDTIIGGAQNNDLNGDCSGFSGPTLFGGSDSILGGAGDDAILGEVNSLLITSIVTTDAQHLGADWLDGGTGDDRIFGQVGNDTIIGGLGNDLVDGGASAEDEARFDTADVAITVNLEFGFALGQGNDTLSGIENVTGSSASDLIAGDAGSNLIDGLAGNDTIIGGASFDVMRGGAGDDLYVVDNALDQTAEAANAGADTVRSSVSRNLGGNLENLVLIGGDAINGSGNDLANKLFGNAAANTLNGGKGADSMSGASGNDIYIVDNAGDVVNEIGGGGIDQVRTAVTRALGTDQENLLLTGTAAINGAGNELDNAIAGNAAANKLVGAAGADTLNGGAGDDTLVGGIDADRLNDSSGNDVFDWNAASESGAAVGTEDTVSGFANGDVLDFATIDAMAGTPGNNAFKFIGAADFSAEGQIRATTVGSNTVVELNTTGASGAEMKVVLTGIVALDAGDLVL